MSKSILTAAILTFASVASFASSGSRNENMDSAASAGGNYECSDKSFKLKFTANGSITSSTLSGQDFNFQAEEIYFGPQFVDPATSYIKTEKMYQLSFNENQFIVQVSSDYKLASIFAMNGTELSDLNCLNK